MPICESCGRDIPADKHPYCDECFELFKADKYNDEEEMQS